MGKIQDKRRARAKSHGKVLREADIIVSLTDLKGKIVYCNPIFRKFSGFAEEDLLGAPHNIIRHPDMPRIVFKLLWDTLGNKRDIYAYVKNMAKDGGFYWVLAMVTPSYVENRLEGFFSVRRKPSEKALETIIPLYAKLLEAEQTGGMEASGQLLQQILSSMGMTYEQFILSITTPEEIERIRRPKNEEIAKMESKRTGRMRPFSKISSLLFLNILIILSALVAWLADGSTLPLIVLFPIIGVVYSIMVYQKQLPYEEFMGRLHEFTSQLEHGKLNTRMARIPDGFAGQCANKVNNALNLLVGSVAEAPKVDFLRTLSITSSGGLLENFAAQEDGMSRMMQINGAMSEMANESESGARQSSLALGEITKEIQQISGSVGHVRESLVAIDELKDRLSDEVGNIGRNSEEVRIIAINAAVEAARAGEQGRSFAVVADAVGVLALKSGSEARKISLGFEALATMIKEVRQDSDSMVEGVKAAQILIRNVNDLFAVFSTSAKQTSQQSDYAKDIGLFLSFGLDVSLLVFKLHSVIQQGLTSSLVSEIEMNPGDSRLGKWYDKDGKEVFGTYPSYRLLQAPFVDVYRNIHKILGVMRSSAWTIDTNIQGSIFGHIEQMEKASKRVFLVLGAILDEKHNSSKGTKKPK